MNMNTGSDNDHASDNEHVKPKDATQSSPHLTPVHNTREELMHMHAKDLLQMLDERHVNHLAVVEKTEIIDLILE
ncbi:hypothetical protein BGZ96_004969, partial [Linnemannia gamsii]